MWSFWAATVVFAAGAGVAAAQGPATPTAAEKAAIFKAAGFKQQGAGYTRCPDDPSVSKMLGAIELEDLNKDGKAEAWVKESSTYCYGNTAEAFVLVGKNVQGAWTILLDQVGVPMTKAAKSNGWPDIEVGGPGMGPFPVFRYNAGVYKNIKSR
ncbi:MAG: hypothetical protein AB7M12_01070 [Hyphomonadaceae bacterium]